MKTENKGWFILGDLASLLQIFALYSWETELIQNITFGWIFLSFHVYFLSSSLLSFDIS